MHGTGKEGTDNNPQVGCRTELRSHDGTEDGSEARDVEKLNHEDFPCGHGDIVHAIVHCHSGRLTLGVGTKDTVHKTAIYDIADDEQGQCYRKCYHNVIITY